MNIQTYLTQNFWTSIYCNPWSWWWWWWWIVFVVWLTDERHLALFPAGTIDLLNYKEVGKSYLVSINFFSSKAVSDPIHLSPSLRKASKPNKNVKVANFANRPWKIRVVGKGSHPEGRNSSRGISEQFLSCWKEEWRELSLNKTEKNEYNINISCKYFKMEGLHFV